MEVGGQPIRAAGHPGLFKHRVEVVDQPFGQLVVVLVTSRRSARKSPRTGAVPHEAPVGSRMTAANSPFARTSSTSEMLFCGMLIVLPSVEAGTPADRGESDSAARVPTT